MRLGKPLAVGFAEETAGERDAHTGEAPEREPAARAEDALPAEAVPAGR
ncbi:hypothetical protein AB0K09_31215 [Streptomyces sp. NPDC049577]